LEKLRFVPVFARNSANAGKGIPALLQHGAMPWPNPRSADELAQVFSQAAAALLAAPKQETLSFDLREKASPYGIQHVETPSTAPPAEADLAQPRLTPAEALYGSVREILKRELAEPKNEVQVAELLSVSKAQAKTWLTRLVADGVLEKVANPLRYHTAKSTERLL